MLRSPKLALSVAVAGVGAVGISLVVLRYMLMVHQIRKQEDERTEMAVQAIRNAFANINYDAMIDREIQAMIDNYEQ